MALAHKGKRPQRQRLKDAVLAVGDKDNLGLGAALAQGAPKGDAVHAGHLYVKEHQVKGHVVKPASQRLHAVEDLDVRLGALTRELALRRARDGRGRKGLVVADGYVKLKHVPSLGARRAYARQAALPDRRASRLGQREHHLSRKDAVRVRKIGNAVVLLGYLANYASAISVQVSIGFCGAQPAVFHNGGRGGGRV